MSKLAAIDTAVRMQLAADDKTIGLRETLNKPQTGYASADEVQLFLIGVANRLRLDTPPLVFNWSTLDAARMLTKQLMTVQSFIEEHTKSEAK
ncbi:hypothetical protein M8R20_10980 [Pseudomonas sp. R2.Fl]|nr:hypothetical protein [Pseudomonas sp. R2.Fl]